MSVLFQFHPCIRTTDWSCAWTIFITLIHTGPCAGQIVEQVCADCSLNSADFSYFVWAVSTRISWPHATDFGRRIHLNVVILGFLHSSRRHKFNCLPETRRGGLYCESKITSTINIHRFHNSGNGSLYHLFTRDHRIYATVSASICRR